MKKHRDKVGPATFSGLSGPPLPPPKPANGVVTGIGVEEPPLVSTETNEGVVIVEVDWNTIPMDQARVLYADLKGHFEKAGAILNNRSMPREDHYTCFMCKTRHNGDPRGKDYSRVDPLTGLMLPVSICGERCWIEYQDMCIKERKANEMFKELGYDAEQRRQLFQRYDKNLEGLINEIGQRIMKAR